MHDLPYNGSSHLRQLHKQDNTPPRIIHRAFRLVILILYFPLVRICQYHRDNWRLNGEISRQDPVSLVVKLSDWFQAREDRIIIHYEASACKLSKWISYLQVTDLAGGARLGARLGVCVVWLWGTVRVGVHVLSIKALQLSQWSPSSRQEYLSQSICLPGNHCNPRWSLSSISFSLHILRTQNHQKSFRLTATLLKMMNRHKKEFPQYF